MDLAKEAQALSALAEPTRRRLYEHVVGQAQPVSQPRGGGIGPGVRAVLNRKADDLGKEMGGKAGADSTGLLALRGFEARCEDNAVVLLNCPFHHLARRHTEPSAR